MLLLRFLLPYTYFYKSRVKQLKYNLYYLIIDWFVPFSLLVYLTDFHWQTALAHFILAYLAFISIYEIGYLGNDIYSVRNESKPRIRIENFNPSNTIIVIWVGLRLLTFLLVSWYLRVLGNSLWLGFYIILGVFFYLHNALQSKELKVMTFVNLAFMRYVAPIFIFLLPTQLMILVAPVFINYVFYRTLMYMDSKDLLNMPSRRTPTYKVNYYLLALGVSVILSLMARTWVPVAVTGYYLLFWITVRIAGLQPPTTE